MYVIVRWCQLGQLHSRSQGSSGQYHSNFKAKVQNCLYWMRGSSPPLIRLSDFKSSYLRSAIETFDLNQLENFTSAYNKDKY